ncbi:MAG: hypothetical protein EBX40_00445 [Gammaproteobacteria bacterium]|nr:hypothetical protein [Gammaproteobacteria bacterium]
MVLTTASRRAVTAKNNSATIGHNLFSLANSAVSMPPITSEAPISMYMNCAKSFAVCMCMVIW